MPDSNAILKTRAQLRFTNALVLLGVLAFVGCETSSTAAVGESGQNGQNPAGNGEAIATDDSQRAAKRKLFTIDGKFGFWDVAGAYVLSEKQDHSDVAPLRRGLALLDTMRDSDPLISAASPDARDLAQQINALPEESQDELRRIVDAASNNPNAPLTPLDVPFSGLASPGACRPEKGGELKNFRSTWLRNGALYDTLTQVGPAFETSCGSGSWQFWLETCHASDGTCQTALAVVARGRTGCSGGAYRWTAGYGGVNYAGIINEPGPEYGSMVVNTTQQYDTTYTINTSWETVVPSFCQNSCKLSPTSSSQGCAEPGHCSSEPWPYNIYDYNCHTAANQDVIADCTKGIAKCCGSPEDGDPTCHTFTYQCDDDGNPSFPLWNWGTTHNQTHPDQTPQMVASAICQGYGQGSNATLLPCGELVELPGPTYCASKHCKFSDCETCCRERRDKWDDYNEGLAPDDRARSLRERDEFWQLCQQICLRNIAR